MNYDNHLKVNNICFQERNREIVFEMKKIAALVLHPLIISHIMVIYLSRRAFLDFSGSFVFVFCDGGMSAELYSGLHVKTPNISVNANSKRIFRRQMGSQRILCS